MDMELDEGRPANGYRAGDLERIRRELNTAPTAAPTAAPMAAPMAARTAAPEPATPCVPRVAAISIKDARKSYPLGSGWVLDGFNMTVPEGTM